MHIPDAYLSPATEAAAYGVMVPIWTIAARKSAGELTSKQKPLLSIGAAFCFAIQMFNIPTVGGTTAHALGSTLLAILVGPWAALLGMSLSLAIQALMFGDGGILSFGANCWDMGFVACFVGYGLYVFISGRSPMASPRRLVAAGIGALSGTVTASLSAGILLGIQPAIAHDAAGHALYCPYNLSVSVPAMVMSHLLMAGPADAIITVAALAYLWAAFPDLANARQRARVDSGMRMARNFVWILILTPIGLVAGGDAWGEWDLNELKERIGYAPEGMARAHELVHPLLPDYGFSGVAGTPALVAGYLVSAVLGCCAVGLFTRGLLRASKVVRLADVRRAKPSETIPAWLREPNPSAPISRRNQGRWFANTVGSLNRLAENTIAAETVARAPGFMQSLEPVTKTLSVLCLLLAVAQTRSLALLVGVILVLLAAAWTSGVRVGKFALRVAETVAFFGLIVALPLAMQPGQHPHEVLFLLGMHYYASGLTAAALIMARLAAGISLALLWNLTTRWFDLLGSLRFWGVPSGFVDMAMLTYRYLFVVTETLAEMLQARVSRQIGAVRHGHAQTYAGAGAAILFAKSHAFSEELHQAMQCRTLGTGLRRIHRAPKRLRDHLVSAVCGITLGFVLLPEVVRAF